MIITKRRSLKGNKGFERKIGDLARWIEKGALAEQHATNAKLDFRLHSEKSLASNYIAPAPLHLQTQKLIEAWS